MSTTQNPFSEVVQQMQQAPQNQRPTTLINGICHTLQQSNNQQTQHYGQELEELKAQIVKALQQ